MARSKGMLRLKDVTYLAIGGKWQQVGGLTEVPIMLDGFEASALRTRYRNAEKVGNQANEIVESLIRSHEDCAYLLVPTALARAGKVEINRPEIDSYRTRDNSHDWEWLGSHMSQTLSWHRDFAPTRCKVEVGHAPQANGLTLFVFAKVICGHVEATAAI